MSKKPAETECASGAGVAGASNVATSAAKPSLYAALSCIAHMLTLVSSFSGIVCLACLFGVLGFLCAIAIPTTGALCLGTYVTDATTTTCGVISATQLPQTAGGIAGMLALLAVLRGCLRYLEQLCNHYIAFKLLANIRSRVFAAMRRLAPAKLSSAQAGNLISLITSDVELLEVFYAHTISPVIIACITSVIACVFAASIHPYLGLVAGISYIIVGACVPVWTYHHMGQIGLATRTQAGTLSNCVLQNLQGAKEAQQFSAAPWRMERMAHHARTLLAIQQQGAHHIGVAAAVSRGLVMLCSTCQLVVAAQLAAAHVIAPMDALAAAVLLFSSFGPVLALAQLGSSLQGTLAAGTRVLSILAEKPLVDEVTSGTDAACDSCTLQNVSFAYPGQTSCALQNVSLTIPKGSCIGIRGASGSGKSTLCKLLMRFWDVSRGTIRLSNVPINAITTAQLRAHEALVEQDTFIFHDTVRANIALAAPTASMDAIVQACKQAAFHDVVMGLPQGYNTVLGEGTYMLSGGERQRLGLARAFLHQSALLLLDEPTSNLDALNEATILTSINAIKQSRTVVLISHRASTLSCTDSIYHVDNGTLA